MEATLTLHQAADRLGVEHTDLNRLIRIGALPEARKVNRPEGRVWVIDESQLPAVASRNAWTIDLRSTEDGASDPDTDNRDGDGDGISDGNSATDAGTGRETSGSDNRQTTSEPVGSGTVALAGTRTATATTSRPGATATGPAEPSMVIDTGHDSGAAPDDQGALVPHRSSSPEPTGGTDGQELSPANADGGGQVSTTEAIDLALLERLLASHEDRVAAQVREQEARHALAALNEAHNRTTGELDIERRERMAVAERYREERRARAAADAKVAELRNRVAREMELAEAEKAEKAAALNRSIEAERDAANAVALLGWRARRRYRKIGEATD